MSRETGGFGTVNVAIVAMVWALLGDISIQQLIGPATEPRIETRLVTSSELRQQTRRYHGLIVRCYQLATRLNESPPRAAVTLQIVGGRTRASVIADDDQPLESCLVRVLDRYRFAGASDQTVTFPLIVVD
jgi:hypothetical protein